jgi:hypothetical protein
MKRLMMPEPEPGGYSKEDASGNATRQACNMCSRWLEHYWFTKKCCYVSMDSIQGPEELMKGENVLIMWCIGGSSARLCSTNSQNSTPLLFKPI